MDCRKWRKLIKDVCNNVGEGRLPQFSQSRGALNMEADPVPNKGELPDHSG